MVLLECSVCGAEFFASRRDKRSCSDQCRKTLKSEYDKSRYKDLRDEIIARACQWQANNRDHKAAYDAQRAAEHSDKIRHQKREAWLRRLENETPSERDARLARARIAKARRRASILRNGLFSVTEKDLRRLCARQNGQCAYCPTPVAFDDAHFDHVVPIARGGTHSIGNLVASCAPCNQSKGRRFVMEWRLGIVVSKKRRPSSFV